VGAGLNNFISNFHGTTSTSAVITAYIYLASSTGVAGVFLILSLAILLAKLALLVSMFLLVFVVLVALLPGGSPDKIMAFAKHILGLIIFVTCGSLLVSAISVLTSLIVAAGSGVVGQYNIMSIIWVGLAPLGAIVLVHHFFKKVLKAPSPFKPSSALAYSATAGGFAGGLGGAALTSRLMDRGKQGIRSAASHGYSKSSSPAGSAPTSRTGGMDPTQANTAKGTAAQGASGTGNTQSGTGGAKDGTTVKEGGRPASAQEEAAAARLNAAKLPGERASAQHASAKATRKADKEETKAAKALHRESLGGSSEDGPKRLRAARAGLHDSMRTHYRNWRTTGGPARTGKKIAIGAAAVALGLPGGLAVGAYAYHRHRARRQAGQPSDFATFRRVGRERRQQALDAYRKDYREKNAPKPQPDDDPFAEPEAKPGGSSGGSSAGSPGGSPGSSGEPTRRMPVDTPHIDPDDPFAEPVHRTGNAPSSERVGDRHVPNRPPEPTPPELYDEPPPDDEE